MIGVRHGRVRLAAEDAGVSSHMEGNLMEGRGVGVGFRDAYSSGQHLTGVGCCPGRERRGTALEVCK